MKVWILLALGLISLCLGGKIADDSDQKSTSNDLVQNILGAIKEQEAEKPHMIQPSDNKTRFFVLGDFGSFTKYFGLRHSALVMESLASESNYSHIITVGDNFYLKGIPNIDSLWHPRSILDVFDREFTGVLPIYATLGNHDCYSDYRNEILFSDFHHQWNMSSDYYELITPLNDGSGKNFVNLMLNS